MLLLSANDRYAANVDPMTCIRPLDGSPRCALMSHRLIARGLPPDSWFMRCSTGPRFDESLPSILRTRRITGAHRVTPDPPMFPIDARLLANAVAKIGRASCRERV